MKIPMNAPCNQPFNVQPKPNKVKVRTWWNKLKA